MLRFGTCSWKYDSWKKIIYSDDPKIDHLKEYSAHFNTVEIDQWFWSLFDNEIVMPDKQVVKQYVDSVPAKFLFTIKAPNTLSLTHHYNKRQDKSLRKNPHFLSVELYEAFLDSISPMKNKIGAIILQFEYLSKEKIGSISELQIKLLDFWTQVKSISPPIAIEIRNPFFLNERYFNFLAENDLAHVLLEGYFMAPITETYLKYKDYIKDIAVIRLHGPDRGGIESISNKNWNQIYCNRDKELNRIAEIIKELSRRQVDIFLNVNNHYEGCAPLTIQKIKKLINNPLFD